MLRSETDPFPLSLDPSQSDPSGPSSSSASSGTSDAEQLTPNKGHNNRQFQSKWKELFPWLKHERSAVTCSLCSKASRQGLLTGSRKKDDAFTTKGFSSWGHALERFRVHETSDCHKLACASLRTAGGQCAVVTVGTGAKAQEQARARHALRRIFDAVAFFSKQGLALRRDPEEEGNVVQLLNDIARHDEALAKWMTRRGTGGFHFTSPEALAAIQRQLAMAVTRQVVAEVAEAPYFALILDETADVSRKEQMAVCLRFVSEELEVRETFIGLYQVDDTSAAALHRVVLDTLQRACLPVNRLRGQCYDGAANMSGRISGLQARIKEDEPRAVFIHCTAHRLNLVVRSALDGVREVRDSVQGSSAVTNFIRDSPKRLAAFQSTGPPTALRPLCPTRWTCSERCLGALLDNYTLTLSTLEAMAGDRAIRPDIACAASGFARTLQSFEFFLGLKLALLLLAPAAPAMKTVQGCSQSVAANLSLARTVREVILAQRDTFPRFWAEVTHSAKELGLDEPRQRRQQRSPRRLDREAEPQRSSTPAEHFSAIYIEAVDWMAAALTNRFEADDSALVTAEQALITTEGEAVAKTAAFFRLDAQRLGLHTQMLCDVARERGSRLKDLEDVVALLQEKNMRKILPAADDLLRIILTAPATSCTAERTFSQLRRIKNWLRSTLSQERLNHAIMLAVHRDRLQDLDIEKEVKEFASQSTQRVNAFGRW